jgi:hypothetical protein
VEGRKLTAWGAAGIVVAICVVMAVVRGLSGGAGTALGVTLILTVAVVYVAATAVLSWVKGRRKAG